MGVGMGKGMFGVSTVEMGARRSRGSRGADEAPDRS